MKHPILPTLVAALAAATASAFEITLSSGTIPLPEADGSFSATETTDGVSVLHAYYLLTPAKFDAYTSAVSPSEAIYSDFLGGAVGWEEIITFPSISRGISQFDASDYVDDNGWDWPDNDEDVYFAAVFVHEDLTRPATNYIARVFSVHTPTEAEEDAWNDDNLIPLVCLKDNIAVEAGRWNVIAPAPLEIHCTAFSVAGGKATATYSISEFSRLGELVNAGFPGSVNVVAAADLQGNSVTNIPASVTSSSGTPGGEGAFTLTFDTPPSATWPALFIRGLEKP